MVVRGISGRSTITTFQTFTLIYMSSRYWEQNVVPSYPALLYNFYCSCCEESEDDANPCESTFFSLGVSSLSCEAARSKGSLDNFHSSSTVMIATFSV